MLQFFDISILWKVGLILDNGILISDVASSLRRYLVFVLAYLEHPDSHKYLAANENGNGKSILIACRDISGYLTNRFIKNMS